MHVGSPLVRVRPLGQRARLATSVAVGTAFLAGCGNVTTDIATATDPPPPVTTVLVEGRPDAIPDGAVPDGATVSGIEAGNGVTGSTAAEFTLVGEVDLSTITDAARTALEGEGWVFVERVYDDTTMQMTFADVDGTSTLTWTLGLTEAGGAGSVIVVSG